jgi:hypothetical protein
VRYHRRLTTFHFRAWQAGDGTVPGQDCTWLPNGRYHAELPFTGTTRRLNVGMLSVSILAEAGPSLNSVANWIGVAAGVAGVATAVVAIIPIVRPARKTIGATETQETLEDRLQRLSGSMRESARLVAEVSAELEAQEATARRLKEEAKTAEALASLHKDQAEAVRKMLDVELSGQARRIRSDAIKVAVASFVAGGGLTLLVTLLVHPLS